MFLQGFIGPSLARPNVVATLSRLGVPAVTETVIPNTMLPTSVIPNIPCGSTYGFVPSCSTNMPTIDTLIPSNVNVIQTRLPVAEPVISNGNIVPNSIPNIFWKTGLPIAETISPNVAPCTTVIQDTSVSNNLANALQLLVVSNLLSNTLPLNDVVAPMRINVPVFEQLVGDGCINKPVINNINPCDNVVNFV
ncbi:hypothetical protein EVAR_103750_1 [Eumeta japonica]|uniref:Uncharacterized protein n=1 Tax=Eumeta variegata TaxID=151549 RepID=A0A4C1ZJ12_EUMVA|nr:hypothetical protein EVAR_103750_1 [Eumeta japonica]